MQTIILSIFLCTISIFSFAQGSLENPVAEKTESGIGVISGWHCTATNITVTIDGASLGKAGSGTTRNDTAGVCGRTDTGYALLYNYNDLTPGNHVLGLYADGQLLEIRRFNTVQSGGAAFVTGLVSGWTLTGFPSSGRIAAIEWSQAKQSFVVTGITGSTPSPPSAPPPPPPPPTPPPTTSSVSSLNGSYSQRVKISYSGVDCFGIPSENVNASFSVTTSGNQAYVTSSTAGGTCKFTFTASNGYNISSFNMSGSSTCRDANFDTTTYRNVTGTNISKINGQLSGSIATRLDYCTQTITFQ